MTVISEMIPLGEYVFLRICQANPKLKSIFGVPGDYNLNLMEHLYLDLLIEQDIKFVGNCNELNAAYCSDGYARILDTFSVMITTLGVGELSAMNGISSAFSEYSPILHIVGCIATVNEKINETEQAKSSNEGSNGNTGEESLKYHNWHHLIQNKNPLLPPNPNTYMEMCEPISIVNEKLTSEGLLDDSNFDKIDNVINKILNESRPGYLFIPADLPDVQVSTKRLNKPFPFTKTSTTGFEKLNDFSQIILDNLYKAEKPAIMSDDLITKFHSLNEFNSIIDKVANNKLVKLYSSRIGKHIDETLSNYIGVYPSNNKNVMSSLQTDTDLLIIFGFSNFETNGLYNSQAELFGKKIKTVIKINPDYVSINDKIFELKVKGERIFKLKELINKISTDLDVKKLNSTNGDVVDNIKSYKTEFKPLPITDKDSDRVGQDKLFNFTNNYLQEGDIIMTEISSFAFSVPQLTFKKNVRAIYNSYYASIGFALPACVGVSMAIKDLGLPNRVLLFEGDGSAQMTIQEISTMIRFNITLPKIFLMNNEGYTIERAIKGENRSYNDIQSWNWEHTLKMFGDNNELVSNYNKFENCKQFDNYFENKDNKQVKSDKLQFYDIMMYKTDYSSGLKFFLGKK